jgi:mannose-6-phosphate isomerase-like protein (cupin superfamily)
MSGYTITQIGPMDSWRDYVGGFRPDTTRPGRRVVDHEMSGRFVGLTANSYVPGEQCGYWHVHSVLEEVYVFLDGEGQMGLDDEIIDVASGTVVLVEPGVMRTWRCKPESPTNLKWICIRAGQDPLPQVPDDAEPLWGLELPW